MSLRTKFILALLTTSLLALALVWGAAHERLTSKFDDLVEARAARSFRGDVAAYWLTYGSWEAGERAEPFPHFVARRKALQAAEGPPPPVSGHGRQDGSEHLALDTRHAADAVALTAWSGPLPGRDA